MANKVLLKKSSVGARVPTTSDVDYGELALNYADGKLYYKTSGNAIDSFPSLTATATLTNKTLTSPVISGGTINNAIIGGTTPAAITGTTVTSTGNLLSTYSAGDEGGEIFLAKPQTNTSITSGVRIDVYQNKLRIWEDGGTNRGAYIDLTAASAGVATNLIATAGGGTVTSITAGTGLTGGTITTSGTIAIDSTVATLTGSQTLTNKTLTTPIIAEIDATADLTLDAVGDIILDADGADILLKDGGTTFGSLTNSGGQLVIKSGSTPTTAITFANDDITVSGDFAATTKSFLIQHPTKEGMKLRYGSLEGPENGVYVRGRVKENVIELPEYWTKLVDSETITVNLTPVGSHQNLFVESILNNKVYIKNSNVLNKSIDCFFVVYGERCDVDKLKVEYAA